MARITPEGASPTTLSEFVAKLGAVYRTALGSDLDLAPETAQGQLIGGESAILVELDEAIVAVSNGLSVSRALRSQLVDAVSFLRIIPRLATRSTATVTLSGAEHTVISSGSRISGAGGALWRLTAIASIPAAGTVDAAVEAVDAGPKTAAADTLTRIVDVVSGWDSVTNAAAATAGVAEETTEEFRRRYARHTGRLAHGSLAAIEAAVLEVASVTDCLVRDNATNASVTVQGQAIAARSLFVAVRGGADADIARAIADFKPGGTPTVGATSVDVPVLDAGGIEVDTVEINFQSVTDIPVTVAVPISIRAGFPGDGVQQIQRGVAAYVNALRIAEPIDSSIILRPIIALEGLSVAVLTIAKKVGGGDVTDRSDIDLADKLTCAEADVTITVS